MPVTELNASSKGLRRDPFEVSSVDRGVTDISLLQCQNLKPFGADLIPWDYGLSGLPAGLITSLNSAGLTTAGKGTHPWPQIIRGRKTTFVADATHLWTLNESTWALTALAPIGILTRTSASIPSGGIWQLADFGPVTLLFNGACTIINVATATDGTLGSTVTYVDTTFYPTSGVNFRGRLLMGGFTGTTLKTLWSNYLAKVVSDLGITAPTVPSLTSDQVWWSSIGGEDMLQYFLPEAVLDGFDHTEDLPNSVSNGTFASATGWTIAGAWSISGGKLNRTASGSNTLALQVGADLAIPLVAGETYEVTFTLSSVSAGNITAYLGGTLGTSRTAAGTYSQYTLAGAGADFGFQVNGAFIGSVDNVYVRKLNGNLADELFLRNEQGHRAMPFQGAVLWTERLSDGVVIYGESGIGALVPVQSPYPTFAFRWLGNIGLGARGAVGGSEAGHLFIDTLGAFCTVGGDLSVKRLGYEEFGLPLLLSGNPITISYNPLREEWFIGGRVSSSPVGYTINSQGIGSTSTAVCSIALLDGYQSVVLEGTASTYTIETLDFDMGLDDPKTLSRYSVAAVAPDIQGTVKHRNNQSGTLTNTGPTLLNYSQSVLGNIQAREFRLLLTGTLESTTQIGRIAVYYDTADKRTTAERTSPNVTGFNA